MYECLSLIFECATDDLYLDLVVSSNEACGVETEVVTEVYDATVRVLDGGDGHE